jgi:hypothetical protein
LAVDRLTAGGIIGTRLHLLAGAGPLAPLEPAAAGKPTLGKNVDLVA